MNAATAAAAKMGGCIGTTVDWPENSLMKG
jgi:hypothetical protein